MPQQSSPPTHCSEPSRAKTVSSFFLKRCIGQRSLRTLLIIPFIIQVVAAVGLTGWIAFRKGRQTIHILAQHYGSEIGQRIQTELRTTLELTHKINAANVDAIALGALSFDDPDEIERHLWRQLHRYPSVSHIYVGNAQGGVRGVGRTWGAGNGGYEYRSYETIDNDGNDFRAGAFHLYRTDDQGIQDPIIDDVYVGYDARNRPWYEVAVQEQAPAWSDIYLYFGERFLGIAASHPVYDADEKLQGVFVTDLELGQLNEFLGELTIGGSGEAFIMERDGTLVASSTDEPPFRLTSTETRTQERLLAIHSNETLIAESTQTLIQCFGSLDQVPDDEEDLTVGISESPEDCETVSDRPSQHFFLEVEDQRYFGHVQPFQHSQGLNWLIVVVLPESDFMAELYVARNRAIAICGTALGMAIPFGIVFLRWVTRPLKRLSEASQAIADGDFSQRLYLNRCDEVGVLSRSFDRMADQVQDSVNSLQAQVAERTVHLEAARKEAEDANRAKSQFLANMSHELRTPLNGILGYAQVLQRDRHLDPKYQRGLQVIQDCGVHLLNLINEVLDLSKIEAQRMELQPRPFAFRPFLDAIADLFRLRAEQKGIAFYYMPHPDLPLGIQADDQKLRQVLINLLGNAIKFTDHGSVTLRITPAPLSTLASAPTLQFHIEDTGPGIAPEDQQAIFQPFRQVGEQRIQEGTGLGLSISYQLVSLMGGQLALDSVVGQGSCFRFELPLSIVPEASLHEQTEQIGTRRVSSDRIIGVEGPSRRVLVIDDIAENRAFVMDLLATIGFEVFEAEHGQSGLDNLLIVQPDVILMDLIMPVMDGFTTAKAIRHDPQWQAFHDVAIIAMSASTLHQGKAQSLAAGCDAFLLKPINTDELLHLLETVLHLEWRYSSDRPDISEPVSLERSAAIAAGTTQSLPPSNQTNDVVAPPEAILETLWQSAQIGDISGILDILDQLTDPAFVPFVRELRQLATDFRVKALQEFLAAFRSNE